MTRIGVFRDDFYNAASVLPQSGYGTYTANGGTLQASLLAGSGDQYLAVSGQTTAQTLVTDTAANIVAQLQNTVAAAYKAAIAGIAAGIDVPPPGVPNLFNLTYTLTIVNNNTSSGAITLSAGTGVSITGTATIAVNTSRAYLVTVLSPTSVSLQNLFSGAV